MNTLRGKRYSAFTNLYADGVAAVPAQCSFA